LSGEDYSHDNARLNSLQNLRSGTLAFYACEPNLWELLARPEGERLLGRHGRLPLLLLYDKEAYRDKPRTHSVIIRALLNNNDSILIHALETIREPIPRHCICTS
jgi:hypothetical protein